MDNFHIDITCDTREALLLGMRLAFMQHPAPRDMGRAMCGYVIDRKGARMVLLWSNYEKISDSVTLPFRMDAEGATDFVSRWLEALPNEVFLNDMDHDGSNSRGWRMYVNEWGRVEGYHGSIVAVEPSWAWHGK